LTAGPDSRVVEFYVDEFDEIVVAGDIAIILVGVVRDAVVVHEANPRLGEMEKSDDGVLVEEVLEKEYTAREINPTQRVSSDRDLLGQAVMATK
jgi:hypothetical protein